MGLIATDQDGKIAFYNSAAERISGIDFSQALGKDPESILPRQFCGMKETLNTITKRMATEPMMIQGEAGSRHPGLSFAFRNMVTPRKRFPSP